MTYNTYKMQIDFNKNSDGLVPAIVQDATTKNVLMLGYMNQEAFEKTQETQKVTFFSRSKQRLWTKGEESGNFLNLVDMQVDCDSDTLLVKVNPVGPACHKGNRHLLGRGKCSRLWFFIYLGSCDRIKEK